MEKSYIAKAKKLLKEAGEMNPGPWVAHCLNVAKAAEIIAKHHPKLDPQKALVAGLLHDIGRRNGFSYLRHTTDGYNFLLTTEFKDYARYCLTHSFLVKNRLAYSGENDCAAKENKFLDDYLKTVKYDLYDELIQLCDVLASAEGFCLMEKRMLDVVLRYGFNDLIIDKWKMNFKLMDKFSKATQKNIYKLLPGVVETTFGFKK